MAARTDILASGYLPTKPADPGMDIYCKGDIGLSHVVECKQFPELEDCSAGGDCAAEFRDKVGNRLRVITYGDGEPAIGRVGGWDITCAPKSQKGK